MQSDATRSRHPARFLAIRGLGLALAWGAGLPASGDPYVPKSDDEVLERLPPGLRASDLRRQREELAADPENLKDSVAMARSYLDIARMEGDARYLGHAQSILGPWWERPSPPPPVLALRGAIRMAAWEYDRALVDLEAAVAADPALLAAQIERVDALVARGESGPARAALTVLEERPGVPPLALAWARGRVARAEGRAAEAAEALARALEAGGDPGLEHEARLLLADLACQLGQPERARTEFARLAEGGRRDVRRLAAHGDFLLDRGEAAEALALLESETALDTLALRVIEAIGRLPDPGASRLELRGTLTNRAGANLEARRRRGDATALLDEVRFRLRAVRDPVAAAAAGRDLWAVRREIGDARWILEAARAAGDGDLAQRVAEWMRVNRIEDARCREWLTVAGGGR